jgi:hypothetical protein
MRSMELLVKFSIETNLNTNKYIRAFFPGKFGYLTGK